MATVIGVGMQMTASAAGMTKGLSEADRALQLLQKIVEQNQQSLAKFGQQATQTSKQLDNLTKTTSLLSRIEIGRLLIDGAQAIAGVFSSVTSQVSGLVSSVNSSIDTLNDLSARTGIGVEQLQKYAFAAKLAGVDTAAFGTAVQKLAVNIGKATPGGELDKSLRAINLSVTQLRALAPEQQFSVIGQAISQLPTAADRAAAAVAIFGKQGAALAPLFREGAASIEELQARAERLGIIISETQVNNVADMNDAFDTVRATIEGIIGQVIGNLAPAVTAVTEQFLKFVEEWSGTQGQGGTGIANAITDVLLRGAQEFAGVFDKFVEDYGGFTGVLDAVAQSFAFTADILSGLSATFKAIFNTFELVGNGIALALGNVLQGIGSYVSSDLEQLGQDIAANAQAQIDANVQQLADAGEQLGNAVSGVLGGENGSAESAGQGAASDFIRGLRDGIEAAQAPEVQIETNADKLRERFDALFNGLVDESSQVTGIMREFEQAMAAAQEDGVLTAEEIANIGDLQAKVNAAIDQENQTRQAARDAAIAQAQADEQRIAAMEKAGQVQNKIADDLAAVEREQLRVQQEINAAREAGDTQRASQAAARLAQLDQYQASLEEQQAAFEQGFGDGFGRVFEATNKQVNDLIGKAAEFGNAGAEAAQQFQEGVARVQQQARDGILNAEAYQQEIERQQALFEQQIATIRTAEEERKAAAQRVEDFLRQGIDARQQAEIDASKKREEREKEAARNVAAIRQKILEEEARNEKARQDGNLKEARSSANSLRQLRGLQREEERIAKGAAGRVRQALTQATSQQNDSFDQFASAATQQITQFNNAISTSVNDINSAMAASAEGLRKIAREERASRTLGPQQVAVSDVRTAEGQQMILDAAAQYQDPALIQMRQSNALLKQINQGLVANLNRIGLPAVIA